MASTAAGIRVLMSATAEGVVTYMEKLGRVYGLRKPKAVPMSIPVRE